MLLLVVATLSSVCQAKPYANMRLGFGEHLDWAFGGWRPLNGAPGSNSNSNPSSGSVLDADIVSAALSASAANSAQVPTGGVLGTDASAFLEAYQSPPSPPKVVPHRYLQSHSTNAYRLQGSSYQQNLQQQHQQKQKQQQQQPKTYQSQQTVGDSGNLQTAAAGGYAFADLNVPPGQKSIRVEPKPLKQAQQEAYKVIEQLQADAEAKHQDILKQQSQAYARAHAMNNHYHNQFAQQQQPPRARQPPSQSNGYQKQHQQQQYNRPPPQHNLHSYGVPIKEVNKDYITVPVAVETDKDKILTQLDLNEIEKEVLKVIPESLGSLSDKLPEGLYDPHSQQGQFSIEIPGGKGQPPTYLHAAPPSVSSLGLSHNAFMNALRPKFPAFMSALSPKTPKISDILRPLLRKVRPQHPQSLGGHGTSQQVPKIPAGGPYSGSHRPDNLDVIHLIANTKQQQPVTYHVNQLVNLSSKSKGLSGQLGGQQQKQANGNQQYILQQQLEQQANLYQGQPNQYQYGGQMLRQAVQYMHQPGPQHPQVTQQVAYDVITQHIQQQQVHQFVPQHQSQSYPAPIPTQPPQQHLISEQQTNNGQQQLHQYLPQSDDVTPQQLQYAVQVQEQQLLEQQKNQQQGQLGQPQLQLEQNQYQLPPQGNANQNQNQNEYIEVVNLPPGQVVEYNPPASQQQPTSYQQEPQLNNQQPYEQYVDQQQGQHEKPTQNEEDTYAPAAPLPNSYEQNLGDKNQGNGEQVPISVQLQNAEVSGSLGSTIELLEGGAIPNFNYKGGSSLDKALVDLITKQVPNLFESAGPQQGQGQSPAYTQTQEQQQPQYEVLQIPSQYHPENEQQQQRPQSEIISNYGQHNQQQQQQQSNNDQQQPSQQDAGYGGQQKNQPNQPLPKYTQPFSPDAPSTYGQQPFSPEAPTSYGQNNQQSNGGNTNQNEQNGYQQQSQVPQSAEPYFPVEAPQSTNYNDQQQQQSNQQGQDNYGQKQQVLSGNNDQQQQQQEYNQVQQTQQPEAPTHRPQNINTNQYQEVQPVYSQSVEYDPGQQQQGQQADYNNQQQQTPQQQPVYNGVGGNGNNDNVNQDRESSQRPKTGYQGTGELKYGQRLRQSADMSVFYGQAEPIDVKLIPAFDGQTNGNRLYLEPSNAQEVRVEGDGSQLTSSSSASTSTISSDGSDNSGGNNGNASSNKMTFTYVKLDEKQGNSNSVGSQRKAVKFGEKIQVDGTASSDAAGSAGTANSADPNQQLFHAYYAPADHKPPAGYVRLSVDEFNELFKDADVQYVPNSDKQAVANKSNEAGDQQQQHQSEQSSSNTRS